MILVTGCVGYIGSRLVTEMLANGQSVRGLVRKEELDKATALEEQGMEIWEGDLINPDSLVGIGQDVDVVFHFAGLH